MKITNVLILLFILFIQLVIVSCTNEPGARLINKKCTSCHTTKRIYKERRPDKEWEEIIERMIRHGAQLSAKDKDSILDYLKKNY